MGILPRKRLLLGSRWEDYIKMDRKEIDYGDVNSSEPA
jgi:hypothetical protein